MNSDVQWTGGRDKIIASWRDFLGYNYLPKAIFVSTEDPGATAMKEVFLAFAFTPQDRELANYVEQLLAGHDVRTSNGKNVGGQALTPAIKHIIDNSDGLIALLTRRDKIAGKGNKYSTHGWVRDELNYARNQPK